MNRFLRELYSCIYRNNIILNYPQIKALNGKVNLNLFHIDVNDNVINLGDYLSILIVDWMLSKNKLSLSTAINSKRHFYAIGSILLMGYQNATIWGSGLPFAPNRLRRIPHSYPYRKLDIRCVRGPLTRKILLSLGHNCSRIYGDPAVLMPAIYQPKIDLILSDYVIIPHFSEEEKLRQRFPKEKIISMKGTDYMSVIDRICSTKKVISSSLHGIILAETYGIPAVFYQDRPEKFNFKYADWYESTNRSFSIETNLESAILKKAPLPPNLDKMRYDLESSFPYDLWECL